ncbi:MAG: helix-hairpin-helix domain-containing protein, partial [Methylocella sp.]
LRASASEGHFRCFAHADLANRFDLLISVPGIGERTAIALLIRMPEPLCLGHGDKDLRLAYFAGEPIDDGRHSVNRTAAGATPARSPISRVDTPAFFNLVISRTRRVVILSVGINVPPSQSRTSEFQDEPEKPPSHRKKSSRMNGRNHFGEAGEIKSE